MEPQAMLAEQEGLGNNAHAQIAGAELTHDRARLVTESKGSHVCCSHRTKDLDEC